MQEESKQHAQAGLIDFLRTDLNLCSTMLDTASLTDDSDHFEAAIARVARGITTMRDFLGRVQEPTVSYEINVKVNALELRMLALQHSSG